MITVGLDFGTHQTKICIEHKEGFELSYEFFKFKDSQGNESFTLPSVIQKGKDNRLTYGFIQPNSECEIIRYFKQATFTSSFVNLSHDSAVFYSIWYVAFLFFDLEEKYGKEFAIQMGVPTDANLYRAKKELAVRIVLSAYRLVEDVFQNDKERFLNTSYDELLQLTEYLPFNQEDKDTYSILVFPEAYACLMPLVQSAKISRGMSLMIDIGGGTTDISFFTILNKKPRVYDFTSINKGLNYLTNADGINNYNTDSNVHSEKSILPDLRKAFNVHVNKIHNKLIGRLRQEFSYQTSYDMYRLMDALQGRPIIYTGGGSTFPSLRMDYGGFKEIIQISENEWHTEAIRDMKEIKKMGLCPILSTSYGLSISVPDDKIEPVKFKDVFINLRNSKKTKSKKEKSYMTFSYYDDYDALK